jgi:hypothetical protein
MKLAIIAVLIIVILVVVFIAVVQPARRAGAERSQFESILKAKQPIPMVAEITPAAVGEFAITQEVASPAPIAIDVKDKTAVYAGPASKVEFAYAKTTEWGREPLDYAGVMQSTSRAMAKNVESKLLRLDTPDHPMVRAQLPNGGYVVCWMNRDNLFCVSGSDDATTAFLTAYPY